MAATADKVSELIIQDAPIPAIATASSSSANNTSQENTLKEITDIQTTLTEMKQHVGEIVKTMATNPSMFTQLSTLVGEAPYWLKITGGAIVTVSPLPLALFSPVVALLSMGILNAGVLAVTMEDHYNCSKNATQKVEEGVDAFLTLLGGVIGKLDLSRRELAKEVEAFRVQNEQLYKNVDDLGDLVETLGPRVETIAATETLLSQQKEELERQLAEIGNSTVVNQEQIDAAKAALVMHNKTYEKTMMRFSTEAAELKTARTNLEKEVAEANKMVHMLQQTVETLSKAARTDAESRESLETSVTAVVSEGKEQLASVVTHIGNSQADLNSVNVALKKSSSDLVKLLERQSKIVAKLEKMDTEKLSTFYERLTAYEEAQCTKLDTSGLKAHGLYAESQNRPGIAQRGKPNLGEMSVGS